MIKKAFDWICYQIEHRIEFPFDIEIGRLCFYCYRHGYNHWEFKNLSHDIFYGENRMIRFDWSIWQYTFSFNILANRSKKA